MQMSARVRPIELKSGTTPMRMPEPDTFRLTLNVGQPVSFYSEENGVTELVRSEHEGFLLLPPGRNPLITRHSTSGAQPPLKILSLSLQPSLFEEALGLMPSRLDRWAWKKMKFQPDKPTVNVAKALYIEMKSGNPNGALFSDQLSMALSLRLVQEQTKNLTQTKTVKTGKKSLEPSLAIIHDGLEAPLSIDLLAQSCGLSRFHFIRLFNAEFGKTPYQYVLEQRIERAKTLLMTRAKEVDGMGLEQIAASCGFASHSHFCQVFKRTTGTSPLRWTTTVGR